jgi:hypothetical protein
MLKKWLARAILAVGLGTFTLGGSSAQAGFTLGDLIAGTYTGPTLTGFDVFYNGLDFIFGPGSYIGTNGGSPPPTPFQITVTPVTVAGVDSLSFNSGWFAPTGTFNDTSISYEVKVLSGAPITDLHLNVTGGTSGNGFYSVDDAFIGIGLPTLGVASTGPSSAVLLTAPITDLFVTKDIFLTGGTQVDSNARISVILQGYSRSVPEPGSIALVLIGGCGAFGLLRRRKHNV